MAQACDVTDPSSVSSASNAITAQLGDVDVLLFNAGSGVFKSVEKVTPAESEAVWRVNAYGSLLYAQAVVPAMRARGSGVILFTDAAASLRGGRTTAAFAPAKAAQRSLAESMARTLWPVGIHVGLIVVDGVVHADSDARQAGRLLRQSRQLRGDSLVYRAPRPTRMELRGRGVLNGTDPAVNRFVGNSLRCASCHLDAGRLANASPLWAAYVAYPAYRSKNKHVNTYAERLQWCFRYSMNGMPPPLGDKVLVALESYSYFLAKGAPTGVSLPGHGYPMPVKPALPAYFAHGRAVYEQKCALCHGSDGQGQQARGAAVFPPLWGPRSFNWGAGMASFKNAAGFIKANMPLSQGDTLTDQEAGDIATFMNSHDRPQDPRFNGSVAETRKKHHASGDMYGRTVNGVVLGAQPLKK